MGKKPENPQAFPLGMNVGMSLRDYFAGQALGSIPLRDWDSETKTGKQIVQEWARCAYHVADAMLEERSK